MTPFSPPPVSALARQLADGRFVLTTELTPPVATDPTSFVARARDIKGLATAINVTDGAGAKAHLSGISAARFLLDEGIEPILQMVCRDRNRLALQSDLLGALALGVRNILVLTGDDPKTGDQPETKPVFDLDGRALLAMFDAMRRERKLPSGSEITGPLDVLLGAGDIPGDPRPGWDASALAAKSAAGAAFVQTQFCMDLGIVRRYAARLVELGIAPRLAILIGVAPIRSARSARWMREKLWGTQIPDAIIERLEKSSDPRAEGVRICAELIQDLAAIPGIAGAHIMAPQNPGAIAESIAAAGVAGVARAATA